MRDELPKPPRTSPEPAIIVLNEQALQKMPKVRCPYCRSEQVFCRTSDGFKRYYNCKRCSVDGMRPTIFTVQLA
jgi:DNA-directed RNA polymerase subunit RPC12/RpoP